MRWGLRVGGRVWVLVRVRASGPLAGRAVAGSGACHDGVLHLRGRVVL